MENVTYIDHPLVQHKISMLRKKTTGTNEFRTLVEEIATLMGYEALRDLPLEDVEVETPIETCMTPMLAGKKLAIVPILRAGLGMVNGVLSLVPSAKIGHIGLYRDEETHEPHEYFCKLPNLSIIHIWYSSVPPLKSPCNFHVLMIELYAAVEIHSREDMPAWRNGRRIRLKI